MRSLRGLLLLTLCVSLSGCATLARLRTPPSSVVLTLQDSALIVGELALSVDRAEQEVFASKLIDAARHRLLGTIILRLLQASQTFARAVANGLPSGAAKLEVNRALTDLLTATPDLPLITRAAGALSVVVGER